MQTQPIDKVINNSSKPQLPTDKAAEYLGISKKTLDTWRSTKRHIIPYYRIGGAIRYAQDDLDRFLQSTRVAE